MTINTRVIGKLILHIFLMLGVVVMIAPFVWMLSSSFKGMDEIFLIPSTLIPKSWAFRNYPESLTALPFGRAYFNSVYIALIVVVAQLVTASLAAYAFAKLNVWGNKILFAIFLGTMMIPYQVTLIPLFIMMRDLGLTGHHASLILPAAMFNAFGVFMLRQFIMSLPNELEEAAVVDGASVPRIFVQIIFPLILPALSAFGIFIFLERWNDYLYPMIFLSSTDTFTVPLMLSYFKGMYITKWPLLMAGTVISVLPVLLVYVFLQNQIIEGVSITGMKS